MSLTELPLNLRGRVFRSPMPFSAYDSGGRVLSAFRANAVSVIVLLAEPDECLRHANCALADVYRAAGIAVLDLPIPDFSIPSPKSVQPVVRQALERARGGDNVAIHCHAGRGRTGLFAACLAREALGLSGDEAIARVRRYIPGAVETPEQAAFVRSYRVSGS
jgi:protein tyrosine phosphatase domain-containing protein 1